MARRRIAAMVLSTFLGSTLAPATAWTEPSASAVASAKSAVVEGRARREKGDHAGAREMFKAAWAIVQTPIIGLDLANEHVALGALIEGREVAVEVTKLPPNPKESDEGKKARADAASLASALSSRIPAVRVVITGGSGIPTVKIDKDEVPAAALANPWMVNPGEHVVLVTTASGAQTQKVTLAEGQTLDVAFDFSEKAKPVPVPEKPAEPQEPPRSPPQQQAPKPPVQLAPVAASDAPASDRGRSNTLSWVSFGLGGAALIVGGVTAFIASSKASSVKERCLGTQCPPETHADYDSAVSTGKTATVLLGVGVVGVAVGFLTWSSGPKAASPQASAGVHLGLGRIEVRGAF